MMPVVSVVIPTFNRSADLRRALASVRSQTLDAWEAVVVDNHSTDDTAAVVAELADPRIRLLRIHNEGVIARSRNLGVRESRGEYVAFLGSDDWWTPRKLELSVRAMHEGADVVYHDLFLVRSGTRHVPWARARTRTLAPPVFMDLLERGNAINNSSAVVSRQLLIDAGGLSEDPDIVYWEDYDCWLRLSKLGARFTRLGRTLGFYWIGGGNASSPERVIAYLERFRERYLEPAGLGAAEDCPAWFEYGMGRACFHLGRSLEARRHLRLAIGGRIPFHKQVKAVATLAGLLARPAPRGTAQHE